MENNSIREFTCNDCQEVTKVDWSKVRPDIDDGTSNIEIHEKGNGYAYYGECMNCGNLVEIEPPVPELVVDNVDVDKDGMYIQISDVNTCRSCWIEAWQNKNDDWEYDFNQYIFHLDNENDIVAKMFQEDLGNYAEDVFDCVMGAINEHEEEYNKLQESKAPTMRDRLKEAKRNRCEHRKTEALEEKNQEAGVCPVCGNTNLDYGDTIMEQVGDYYGYNWKCNKCNHTGTEWYYMSFVDVYNTNTGEESHQEGICPDCGSDLMYDNFVPDGMDGYYEVYCDNCGFTGKEDYNLDFTDHTVNEEINENKDVKTEVKSEESKKEEAKSQGDIIKYNGYIAEIDEPNTEAPDESIVFIYKNDNDYKNGNYIEQVSLKNNNIEKYIGEYIDDTYGKKEEAKFKDKVKAIKKSLKKNDKRLSDKSAEKSAEKIAGSMVKKEESRYTVYDYANGDTMQDEEEKGLEPSQFIIYDNKKDDFYYDKAGNNPVFDTEEGAKEYIRNHLKESKKVTEGKTSEMDTVAIIMELEGGELTIEDTDDWNKVKEVANSLKGSQGFYGRLLRSMLESEEEFGGVENLPFPITM